MQDPPALHWSWAAVVAKPELLAVALAEWLPGRRWFAGKGRAIDCVSLHIAAPDDPVPDVVLTIATVTFEDGGVHRYAMPLQHIVDWEPPDQIAVLRHGSVIDAMRTESGAAVVVDLAVRARSHTAVQLLGGEQSNSSVIVDNLMIAKLVRRLEPGINPDVEVPRHLSHVGFAHAPGLIAHFDVELTDGTANAVIVHDAIANEGDLWSWIGDHPDQAESVAELVGRRTAELHTALATVDRRTEGEEFWPEPFTLESQLADLDDVRRSLVETQRLLDGRSEALAAPADDVMRRFQRLAEEPVDVSRIRIHGDLHLGQILWTEDDVMFIDFEGEPARPMSERAVKRVGLVDVAGLLRSFDYAGRNAGRDPAWTAAANQRLLEAYLGVISPTLIPRDPNEVRLLLDLYLLEKSLYEIRYEIAHRPDWLHLPLAAAEQLVVDP